MAEYGFEATNDANVITISSSTRLLVFSERGTVRIRSSNSDTPGYGSATFAKPIRTAATPELFVRVASNNRPTISVFFRFTGGPGNWTGFQLTAAVSVINNLMDHTLEFVACKYSDTPASDEYGMEMYEADGSGGIIFNSTDAPVIYQRFTKRWTKSSDVSVVRVYQSGLPIASDDFIGISSFDLGAVFFGYAHYAGVTIMESNSRVLAITVNAPTPIVNYQDPSLGESFNLCMPVCKFPSAVYYNQ